VILRDYQQEAVNAVWTKLLISPTALCILPTGAGKSVIFEHLIKISISKKPDIKILVLFNKTDLLQQIFNRIQTIVGPEQVGMYIGSLQKYDNTKTVTCGMIQSLSKDDINYNLIIVDEVHNLDEKKGRYIDFIRHQMQTNPKTKVVGFTATPFRESGYIYGKNKLFEEITYIKKMQDMIDKKYLVPPISKQPEHLIDISKMRVVMGDYDQKDIDKAVSDQTLAANQVKDALVRMQGRKKIVWFCANINHANTIKFYLVENKEKAVTLHSNLEPAERRDNKLQFETDSETRHMTFVTIVSEGYDYPPIDCVVLLRPTRSPNLMIQTCGRGLRPFAEKEDCLILDYASVITTIGPLDDPLIQEKGTKSKQLEKDKRTKICKACQTINSLKAIFCEDCGEKFVAELPKDLLDKAQENIDFFSKQNKITQIEGIHISKHISKNGNKCIKIQYLKPVWTMEMPIDEYFIFDHEYSYVKFNQRAIQLGLPLCGTIDEQVTKKPSKIPKEVEYTYEGKYPRIKRLIFGEEKLP
jgi:DNA repair protein RadD